MEEKTTNTSNDVSRKEAKKEYISDDKMRKIIEEWAEGKWIYVAATDPEFLEKDIDENTSSSASSGNGSRAKRVRTTEAVTKKMTDLLNYLNVTIGAKNQTPKVKEVRKKIEQRKSANNTKDRKERDI